jgi:hypothetical protein
VSSHRGVLALLGDEVACVLRHRVVRVVVDLGSGDHRQPLVEQRGEAADHARLGLAALTEEDHVVAGEECVLELREDGVLVAEHTGEEHLAGGHLGDGVPAELLLHRHRLPTGLAELAERGGTGRHPRTVSPSERSEHGPRLRGERNHRGSARQRPERTA